MPLQPVPDVHPRSIPHLRSYPGFLRTYTSKGTLGTRSKAGPYAARANREEAVVSVQHHHLYIDGRPVPATSPKLMGEWPRWRRDSSSMPCGPLPASST